MLHAIRLWKQIRQIHRWSFILHIIIIVELQFFIVDPEVFPIVSVRLHSCNQRSKSLCSGFRRRRDALPFRQYAPASSAPF